MSNRTVPADSILDQLRLDGRIVDGREDLRGHADRGHAGLDLSQGEVLEGLDLADAAAGKGTSMSCGVDQCGRRRPARSGRRMVISPSPADGRLDRHSASRCSDLALGVDRDDRQRHADRLGQVLETRRRHRVGPAVVVDFVAAGELVPHVDPLDRVLERGRAVGPHLLDPPDLDRDAHRLGGLRVPETVVRIWQRCATFQRSVSPGWNL